MKQGRIAMAAKVLTLPVTLALALTGVVCVSPAGAADTAAAPQTQQTKKTAEKTPAKATDKSAKAAPQKSAPSVKAGQTEKSAQTAKPAAKPTQVAKVAPAKKPMGDTIEEVHNKLDTLARAKLRHMNESLRPCQTRKDVVHNGNEFVARYLAVDPDSLSTDVHDAQGPGAKYVGLIVYHEQEYESRAATKEAALAGDFAVVKARRVTEIIRYDKGKWID